MKFDFLVDCSHHGAYLCRERERISRFVFGRRIDRTFFSTSNYCMKCVNLVEYSSDEMKLLIGRKVK